jgi:hypothetical protein
VYKTRSTEKKQQREEEEDLNVVHIVGNIVTEMATIEMRLRTSPWLKCLYRNRRYNSSGSSAVLVYEGTFSKKVSY